MSGTKGAQATHLAGAEAPHAAAGHGERGGHAGGVGHAGELEVRAGGVAHCRAQHGAQGGGGDGRQGGGVRRRELRWWHVLRAGVGKRAGKGSASGVRTGVLVKA